MVGLGLLLAACQDTGWRRNLIHDRYPVAIYVERKEFEGKVIPQGFTHPAEVSPQALESILLRLRFRSWGFFQGTEVQPVFEEAEAAAVAGPLSDSLKRIGPDERIRFLVARTRWQPLFLGPKGTSAVVFLTSNDELNVAFDMIHQAVSDEGGDPRSVVFTRDPVKFTGGGSLVLLPPPATVRTEAGQVYPAWVVVSLPQLRAEAKASVQREPSPTPPLPEPRVDSEVEEMRRRLKVLEELYRSGSISAEEHEKARLEILRQRER